MGLHNIINETGALYPFIASLAIVFGAAAIFWRKYVSPVHQLLMAQLNSNGGGSLVDKVDGLIESQDHIMRRLTIVEKKLGIEAEDQVGKMF